MEEENTHTQQKKNTKLSCKIINTEKKQQNNLIQSVSDETKNKQRLMRLTVLSKTKFNNNPRLTQIRT